MSDPNPKLNLEPLADIHDEVMYRAGEEIMAWLRLEARTLNALAEVAMDHAISTDDYGRWRWVRNKATEALGCTVSGRGARSAGAIARITLCWAVTEPEEDAVHKMRMKLISFLGPVDGLAFLSELDDDAGA